MTIRDMLKKVHTFNEIAEIMGTERAELRIKIPGCDAFIASAYSAAYYKKLATEINDTFIKPVADAILSYNGYEFDVETDVSCSDGWGTNFTETVETRLFCI